MVNSKAWGFVSAAVVAIGFMFGCGQSGDNSSGAAGSEGTKSASNLSGGLSIDGSSTVYPIVNKMGEDFGQENSGLKVDVNKSGTGSGMQKFARAEIDIATASRPVQAKEVDSLKQASIDFYEVPIAYDGVCVIVSKDNAFIDKLTPEELAKMWSVDSKVAKWSDVRPGWPSEKINFYGPTDNHGTYEYFTEAINKKKGNIRKDYQANQDYNVVVTSVAGDKAGVGYVGFNYYANNKDKVKVVPIDSGKGPITPSEASIIDGSYTPLSRPLFIYVNKKAYDSKSSVKAFIDFALGKTGAEDVKESNYVALPTDAIDAIKAHLAGNKTGTVFADAKPGMTIQQVLAKETSAK